MKVSVSRSYLGFSELVEPVFIHGLGSIGDLAEQTFFWGTAEVGGERFAGMMRSVSLLKRLKHIRSIGDIRHTHEQLPYSAGTYCE
jgi:hypothetical protein